VSVSLPTPRTVAAGRGAEWISEGYGLFKRDPVTWIIVGVIWLILLAASGSTSFVIGLALTLLMPVVIGGLMLACDAQQRGGAIHIEHLWAGFNEGRAGPLITVGVWSVLGMLLVAFGVVIALGATVGSALISGGGLESLEVGLSALLAMLAALLVLIPITMALWFAPALVALQRVEPLAALKLSFRACVLNIPSMSVNGLLTLLIVIAATIPLFIGWLVAVPVITASIYFSYRDIFSVDQPVFEVPQ